MSFPRPRWIAISIGLLALCVAPAGVTAATSSQIPGSYGEPPPKIKSYAHYCAKVSKKKVDGKPSTPFNLCKQAMKKLDKGGQTSPAKACAAVSKEKVAGKPGTPFSQCVAGGTELLGDKA